MKTVSICIWRQDGLQKRWNAFGGNITPSPLTPQFLILVRETELPFYLRSAWKIKPIWLSDSCCYFFLKGNCRKCLWVILLTSNKFVKSKEKKRGWEEIVRRSWNLVGREEIFIEAATLELNLYVSNWDVGGPSGGQGRCWPLQLPFPLSISPFYLSKGFEISTSRVDQLVKNLPAMQETPVLSWVRKFPWRRDKLPSPVFLGFPGGSDSKKNYLQCGRPGFSPWVRKIPLKRAWQPTPDSCLENPRGQKSLAGYCPWSRKELDTT